MPVIRMTEVYPDNAGQIVVVFDDNNSFVFKNRKEMEDSFKAFTQFNSLGGMDYFMRMLMVGDYIKNGDDTIGCNYDPESPSAVWLRRTP